MTAPAYAVSQDALHAALERSLAESLGRPCRVASLTRQPTPYRSSFALEALDVCLEDGTRLSLMFKDASRAALSEEARQAKHEFLYHPRREIAVYQQLLARQALGTARCYGALVDEPLGRFWLFLERVVGVELYQVGEFSIWQDAARWLARLHVRFAPQAQASARKVPLLTYDAALFGSWMARARQLAHAQRPARADAIARIDRLATRYEQVLDRLLALPRTLIHGEYYPSNIMIERVTGRTRVCPVDWDMAALAPGLMDLAALTSGRWSGAQREALALAYAQEWVAAGGAPKEARRLLDSLDLCRLQVAIQWLGWSAEWAPPSAHAHDWLRDVAELAKQLER